ncbi:thymidylate kinase [Hydrogenoanaerobacterium sp.]|uniref:dTMP kinase n=1 Tax=Hydrogenoanaerobacterium sp. TaxID=2953763 RepID=UPI00289D4AED|nr:thymidylate kinase [Hydrogenoanaerobacterium sp.]
MRFIEIEGLDGSGKETQSKLLAQRLNEQGIPALRITFPDYEHPWSVFVKMYLGGEFGGNVDDVNAYTATSFYALDRYASFKKNWEQAYKEGAVIIADRYVGSNLIHQMSKLPREQWDAFFQWQQDFEFDKLGLPRPDKVLYLQMEPSTSKRLMEKRYQGDENKKDLHERNFAYLMRCRETANYAVQRSGWEVIRCCDGEAPYTIEAIHDRIMSTLGNLQK